MSCLCRHHLPTIPACLAPETKAGRSLLPENVGDIMVAYTSSREPSVRAWAREMWRSLGAATTDADVRAIIDAGGLTPAMATRAHDALDELLTKVKPRWEDTMAMAARQLPVGVRELLTAESITAWTDRRRASVLAGFDDVQNRAIRTLIDYHSAVEPLDQRTLAAILRPVLGLTPEQTKRLLNLKKQFEADGSKGDTLQQRLTTAATSMQKARAQLVARTELASAWNGGVQVTMERAVEAGAFERPVQKVWRAQRGKVCAICAGLNGRAVPLNKPFDAAFEIAPAHPGCRCVITYEEVR